ncbi:hypothetical protein [Paenibacillus sp. URB8-2]|uniref:hypothetical protein n=1 Tax=Paenibacillus sp. URB8-2 TaxID=2741301 RepID=UPI0015BFF55F|nr:hypothetical protein [Paenibacillus sp. URB8-2]BCG57095.1 hypothetical protein PUR_05200 [Paenibacillus sp. URB8-2]
MWKKVIALLSAALLLTACSSNTDQASTSFQTESLQEKVIFSYVKKQEGKTLQEYEPSTERDIAATIEDSSNIETFTQAIKESKKIPGTLNVGSPTYEVTFQKDGVESSYYLWIDTTAKTSNAMYMNKGDTETGYSIPVELTDSINKMLVDAETSK